VGTAISRAVETKLACCRSITAGMCFHKFHAVLVRPVNWCHLLVLLFWGMVGRSTFIDRGPIYNCIPSALHNSNIGDSTLHREGTMYRKLQHIIYDYKIELYLQYIYCPARSIITVITSICWTDKNTGTCTYYWVVAHDRQNFPTFQLCQ
jgi:hypothetical protein